MKLVGNCADKVNCKQYSVYIDIHFILLSTKNMFTCHRCTMLSCPTITRANPKVIVLSLVKSKMTWAPNPPRILTALMPLPERKRYRLRLVSGPSLWLLNTGYAIFWIWYIIELIYIRSRQCTWKKNIYNVMCIYIYIYICACMLSLSCICLRKSVLDSTLSCDMVLGYSVKFIPPYSSLNSPE